MRTFYATIGYGQSFNGQDGVGYVEIQADDEMQARHKIAAATDNRWAFMYKDFEELHPMDRTKLGEL